MAPGRRWPLLRLPPAGTLGTRAPDDFVLVRLGLLRDTEPDPAAHAPVTQRSGGPEPVLRGQPVPQPRQQQRRSRTQEPQEPPATLSGPPPEALFEPGALLARRYRLVEALPAPDGTAAALWRAVDEVLARPVAVTVLPARDHRSVAFLEAAARAGSVGSRALTRVYDAAVEPRPSLPSVAYVIREWVPGRSLVDLLRDGPLPVHAALDLGVQAAAALVAVHDAGMAHTRVHPGNVLVDGAGRLRLTDTAVAAVLHGWPAAARPTDTGGRDTGGRDTGGTDLEQAQAGDVRDLAAVLTALLTARWPALGTRQPARGLPLAPAQAGQVLRPGQLRAGVPRAVDAVVLSALQPDRGEGAAALTAASLLARLEAARDDLPPAARGPAVSGRAAAPGGRAASAGRRSRSSRVLTGVAGLLVVGGTAGWGVALARDAAPAPTPAGARTSALPSPVAAPAAPPRLAPLDLRRVLVQDFDPYGSPPRESRRTVPAAYDGDPATTWRTERYRSARLGGIKPGVGLLVDLGGARALSRVEVDVRTPGAALELRAGNSLGADETSLPVLARDQGSPGRSVLVPPGQTRARFWLVWITRLPVEGERFQAGVDELVLRPAAG